MDGRCLVAGEVAVITRRRTLLHNASPLLRYAASGSQGRASVSCESERSDFPLQNNLSVNWGHPAMAGIAHWSTLALNMGSRRKRLHGHILSPTTAGIQVVRLRAMDSCWNFLRTHIMRELRQEMQGHWVEGTNSETPLTSIRQAAIAQNSRTQPPQVKQKSCKPNPKSAWTAKTWAARVARDPFLGRHTDVGLLSSSLA